MIWQCLALRDLYHFVCTLCDCMHLPKAVRDYSVACSVFHLVISANYHLKTQLYFLSLYVVFVAR